MSRSRQTFELKTPFAKELFILTHLWYNQDGVLLRSMASSCLVSAYMRGLIHGPV